MITVDILDVHGSIIGELEFPEGTSQDVIDAQLAMYAAPVVTPTSIQRVSSSIADAVKFGNSLIIQYAASNVLIGITVAGKTQLVADYFADLSYYLKSGSLYAAVNEINRMIADTSDAKTALNPYVTNNILYSNLNLIQDYLVLPRTPNPGS
jgi:hypothetical protein